MQVTILDFAPDQEPLEDTLEMAFSPKNATRDHIPLQVKAK